MILAQIANQALDGNGHLFVASVGISGFGTIGEYTTSGGIVALVVGLAWWLRNALSRRLGK
jgi:hypothetical protein